MVERALQLVEPSENPGFVPTSLARQIEEGVRSIAADGGHGLVVTRPGLGKTATLNHLAQKYHDQCHLVTLNEFQRSRTQGLRALLDVLSKRLSLYCPVSADPGRTFSLVVERLELLRRDTGHRPVVMCDEAQVGKPELLNGFRYFADQDLCALLVAANHHFFDAQTGQVDPVLEPLYQRRRFLIEHVEPFQGDADALLDAYGIVDKEARDVLALVVRERALRGLVSVIEKGQQLGAVRVPTVDDLKEAVLLQDRDDRRVRARRRR